MLMHEMALVREVIGTTLEAAERQGASAVKAVYLRIGTGRDIVVELFSGLFDHLARGTAAEGAELVYERVPLITRCNDCGKLYRLNIRDRTTWPCPACRSMDYALHSGMEFSIDRIEVVDGCLSARTRSL